MAFYEIDQEFWKQEKKDNSKLDNVYIKTNALRKKLKNFCDDNKGMKSYISSSTLLDWGEHDTTEIRKLEKNIPKLKAYANMVHSDVSNRDVQFSRDLSHAIEKFSVIDIKSFSVMTFDFSKNKNAENEDFFENLDIIELMSNDKELSEIARKLLEKERIDFDFKTVFDHSIMNTPSENILSKIFDLLPVNSLSSMFRGKSSTGEISSDEERILDTIDSIIFILPIGKAVKAGKALTPKILKVYLTGMAIGTFEGKGINFVIDEIEKKMERKLTVFERAMLTKLFSEVYGKGKSKAKTHFKLHKTKYNNNKKHKQEINRIKDDIKKSPSRIDVDLSGVTKDSKKRRSILRDLYKTAIRKKHRIIRFYDNGKEIKVSDEMKKNVKEELRLEKLKRKKRK